MGGIGGAGGGAAQQQAIMGQQAALQQQNTQTAMQSAKLQAESNQISTLLRALSAAAQIRG